MFTRGDQDRVAHAEAANEALVDEIKIKVGSALLSDEAALAEIDSALALDYLTDRQIKSLLSLKQRLVFQEAPEEEPDLWPLRADSRG